MSTTQPLTQAKVLRFYLPLAANSVLMMIEMPAVTAGISRLPDPEVNLAGYGIIVALSFTLMNLGVPLTHTGNALGRSRGAFRLLRTFSLGVSTVVALITAAIYFTPLYGSVVEGLLGVPAHVADPAQSGVQMMIVAGFAIGWRRFYHGVLIRHGYTAVVGWITVIRAVTLLTMVYVLVSAEQLTGIQVAGLALATSAAVEAAVVNVVAEMILRRPGGRWESDSSFSIDYRTALFFFLPLSLTIVFNGAVRPVITSAMTRLPDPVLSLAAFPVAYGVFNLVYSPLWVLTQLVIALVKDAQSYHVVVGFARRACVVGWLFLFGLTFTPLVDLYLHDVLRVPDDVRAAAIPACRIMSLYLLIGAFHSQYQGLLVAARRTMDTQMATLTNLMAAGAILTAGVFMGSIQGVLLGALAYVVGFGTEVLTLRWRAVPVVRELLGRSSTTPTVTPRPGD